MSPLFYLIVVYLVVALPASAACLIAYGLDKRRAQAGDRRISERTLHRLALAGGWPGAILGQRLFRHKTQKVRFRLTSAAIIALHALGLALAGWLLMNS
jgi:uncharacterized membrane protein YsdA (DUF1294 family)